MHLVVLHHGLWGNSSHMLPVINYLKEAYPNLVFLNANCSSGTFTYDGIDIGGDRLLKEIQNELEKQSITKISLIGYSLGGLFIRYVVGKLYFLKVFEKVEPIQLITIATPNLGTRYNWVMNKGMKLFLTRVGHQLTISDVFLEGRSLLDIMSDPEYDFYKGLSKFKKRMLFANIVNDRSVRYTTASIKPSNPYTKYERVVLDPEYSCIVSYDSTKPFVESNSISLNSVATFGLSAVILPILMPIWVLLTTVGLSTAALMANRRHKSLELDHDWIADEKDAQAKKDLESPVEEPAAVVNDGEDSVKDKMREKLINNLNSLAWKKVDVFIDVFNSHGAIVMRAPYGTGPHECVLKYLAKEFEA